jgi:hypothetical protein
MFPSLCLSHSLTRGEWEKVMWDKKERKFEKKRKLVWKHEGIAIRTCEERVWGELDLYYGELHSTHQQLGLKCNFISYKEGENNKLTMILSSDLLDKYHTSS